MSAMAQVLRRAEGLALPSPKEEEEISSVARGLLA